MERKNKLKKVLPVILLLFLITIIIGVTYAAYLVTLSSGENSITTGLVSMSYTESTNVISIENALPISDSEGKTSSNYFDFSVTSNLTLNENKPNTDVNYSIEIEPLSANTLQDNQIKLYLEDTTNNRVIIDSRLISNITNYTLYSTSHTHNYNLNTITTNYRLRAWIDYNTDVSNWNSSNTYEYKFRINVNGDIDAIQPGLTPEYCFTTSGSTITGYNCYEGNNSGYETITDVVIPSTIGGVTMTAINKSKYIAYNDVKDNNLKKMYNIISLKEPYSGDFKENPFSDRNLTSVVISNTITYIGYGAFYNNNLTDVTIGNGVTTIGAYAFEKNNLTTVTIPENVTTIENYAFHNNNLTNVTIGNGVITIGDYAFYYNNLTNVTIPSSVTTIRSFAFLNNNLEYVLINEGSNLSSIRGAAFGYNYGDHTLVIYNNSGKSFDWGLATGHGDGYTFVTGSIPSYTKNSSTYGPVEVVTGYPS